MKQWPLSNFVKIDSVYGPLIVNRHCSFQAEALIKTGRTHIEHELAQIFQLIDALPDGAIVIDGGTNIGLFTIPVAHRLKDRGGKVLGFEAQKMIYYAAAGAVALNDLDNCYLYNLGLTDEMGRASVDQVDYNQAFDFGTVRITAQVPEDGSPDSRFINDATINTITIDALELPRLDFIKLDIEGSECLAIQGGRHTIARDRPMLWIEYFLVGEQAIREALAGIADYEFFIMDAQNMLCVPLGKMQELKLTVAPPVPPQL